VETRLHLFLNSVLDIATWSVSLPGPFISGERASVTPWIGDWLGHSASLYTLEKGNIPWYCMESNNDFSVSTL
jgi:hypothetical protein